MPEQQRQTAAWYIAEADAHYAAADQLAAKAATGDVRSISDQTRRLLAASAAAQIATAKLAEDAAHDRAAIVNDHRAAQQYGYPTRPHN